MQLEVQGCQGCSVYLIIHPAHLPTLLPPYTVTRWPPAATCSAPTDAASWKKENLPFPAFPEITGLTLIVGDWPINHVWTNSRSMEVIVDCVARTTSYVHSWTKRLELFKFELRVEERGFVHQNQDFCH